MPKYSYVALFLILSLYTPAAEPFYTAEVAFTTAPKEGTYKASVRIHLVTEKGGVETKELIAAPSVTARLGQDAQVSSLEIKSDRSATITAFCAESDKDGSASYAINLTERGKTVFKTKIKLATEAR